MRCLWGCALLLVWAVVARGLSREELYPFGSQQGDHRLVIADDISSGEVQLDRTISFFDQLYSSIFVSTSLKLCGGYARPTTDCNHVHCAA